MEVEEDVDREVQVEEVEVEMEVVEVCELDLHPC